MKTRKLLWLDDLRNPFLNEEKKISSDIFNDWDIHWVLNYKDFVKWIELYGLPDAISFDHDLAKEHYTPSYFWDNYEESKNFQDWKSKSYKYQTGEGCAKWLVKHCTYANKKLPKIFIHSANPVGVDKIKNVIKIT